MLEVGLSIDLAQETLLSLPLDWRERLKLRQGRQVNLFIEKNIIKIKVCNQITKEISSTIGKSGMIYLPAEIRRRFIAKKQTQFQVYIDDGTDTIILK